jgi:hypothetical protein
MADCIILFCEGCGLAWAADAEMHFRDGLEPVHDIDRYCEICGTEGTTDPVALLTREPVCYRCGSTDTVRDNVCLECRIDAFASLNRISNGSVRDWLRAVREAVAASLKNRLDGTVSS